MDEVTTLEPASTPPPPALLIEQRSTQDPYWVYLNSLESAESKRTMKGTLDQIAKILSGDDGATGEGQPWHQLTRARIIELKDMLIARGYSPSHVNKHLIAIRRILEESFLLGLMTADEYQRARSVKSVKGTRVLAGRNINPDELVSMLEVWDDTQDPKAVRNAALIAVLYSTGMRRAEAADVLLERYDSGERSLRIVGKRNKERYVYISPTTVPVLNAWLSLLGARRGPMFRPIHKTGKIQDGPMTPRAIGYIVDRTCKLAHVPPTSTHDFRRTHTGDLLSANVDLATAQKLLGHASATTTALYDRRGEQTARAAVDNLTLPSRESLRDAEPLPQEGTPA